MAEQSAISERQAAIEESRAIQKGMMEAGTSMDAASIRCRELVAESFELIARVNAKLARR
jgi:hypothetical protein